jgi:hypothetical protein
VKGQDSYSGRDIAISASKTCLCQPPCDLYPGWVFPENKLSYCSHPQVTRFKIREVLVFIFFNWNSGGGVKLGPLGTAATNRPTVPTPSDYDDGEIGGMMIGRGNRSARRKPDPVPLCPLQITHAARTRTRAGSFSCKHIRLNDAVLNNRDNFRLKIIIESAFRMIIYTAGIMFNVLKH